MTLGGVNGLPQFLYHANNAAILDRLTERSFDSKQWFDLKVAAERLSLTAGFDRLLSLEGLPLRLYEHQRQAILRVLRHMRGRAVLADEVGLGKTIEAGIILREYLVRGLVRRVLILVPSTLVGQWREELAHKLGLTFHDAIGISHWEQHERIVAALDRAKRGEHAAKITQIAWDMVIVDEAHRLKNRDSVNWQFVNAIQKKYVLLLTATPVQNDLSELYNLITLLKPGQLHTYAKFRREFTYDRHSPRNLVNLRSLLDDVMVRTSRRETLLRFPRREVYSLSVPMSSDESAFYKGLLDCLRQSYKRTPKGERNLLPYILLLRQATSHPLAAARTLKAIHARGTLSHISRKHVTQLTELAKRIVPSKFAVLQPTLEDCGMHAILFTGFKETVRQLVTHFEASSTESVIAFHGGLDAEAKDAAIRAFREQRGILVSTETGSEGMNLQFCSTVVNYDLPWNPLRLEQRIGRVHRLGQESTVRIYNLATEGTVESYILYLLGKKIDMFNKVVGELEGILSNVTGQFEWRLAETLLTAADDASAPHGIEQLGSELEEAVRMYDDQRRLVDTLFSAQKAPRGNVATEVPDLRGDDGNA